jgi:hypothetical protein
MAPTPHTAGSATRCAVTHGTETVEFADLLVADDEWVRREFDAIVAAGWGGVAPPRPAPEQGAHWPRRPGFDARPTPGRRPRELLTGAGGPAHQRGPPGPAIR